MRDCGCSECDRKDANEMSERKQGHSALRVKDGKITKFDPHPSTMTQPLKSARECAEEWMPMNKYPCHWHTQIREDRTRLAAIISEKYRPLVEAARAVVSNRLGPCTHEEEADYCDCCKFAYEQREDTLQKALRTELQKHLEAE